MNCGAVSDAAISRTYLKSIHPTGAAIRICTIGAGPTGATVNGPADVVLLLPTSEQCRKPGWVEGAVSDAVGTTAADGMIYVLSPRRWRAPISRLLQRHGFVSGTPVVHLASGAARFYVPLVAGALQHALLTWPLSPRWQYVRRLINAAPSSVGLLASALPVVGFPATRPNLRPFDWLLSRLPGGSGGYATVATSWRGPQNPTVLFGFDAGANRPSLVAKSRSDPRGEVAQLHHLGPGAREAGIRVPQLVEDDQAAANGWLLQTAVPGRPASTILAERPVELARFVDDITAWLGRWHRATLKPVELTRARCEQEILAPARLLSGVIEGAEQYNRWLTAVATDLIGQQVPFVSAHGDLTMANLLRDLDGRTGLVDWEAARPQALPLADFWYATCDAAAAIDGYRSRHAAFLACFAEGGAYRDLMAAHEQKLRAVVGGPSGWLQVCFHACWLGHAANEHVRDGSETGRPFLMIANALSQSIVRSGEVSLPFRGSRP